jgi:hypothetical protein
VAKLMKTFRLLTISILPLVTACDPDVNNQVTEPAPGSYEAELMSIASTVYSYFGVQIPTNPTAQNPAYLTADVTLNLAGVPAIDETQTSEPSLL